MPNNPGEPVQEYALEGGHLVHRQLSPREVFRRQVHLEFQVPNTALDNYSGNTDKLNILESSCQTVSQQVASLQ